MTATTNDPQAKPAVDMVNLTVDGIPVSVPKGTMIIRAAEKAGIAVPRFCDHPLLDPVGACRQCLVEVAAPGRDGKVAKMPKPQPSCAVAVSEGMEVSTQHTSEVADKAQQGVMEFLLINHPLDCPVCDKGGECPLQNQAMSNGRAKSRFDDVKRTYAKPVNVSTEVLLDRERCVLCQRCTRFSDQIAGDPFIALSERGAVSQIGIYQDDKFQSYFSGNTVQICPVGALTGAAYRFRSRPFDLVSTPGACEHCASGCGIRTDHRRGVVLRRMAMDVPEVNEEWTCDKGRWAFASATLPDRITSPLVRGDDGVLRIATWPEALAVAAAGLRGARGRAGVLVGGRVSAEDAYAYSKFARVVLGTNDIDFRARAHTDEEAAFLAMHVASTAPGHGGVTYADLESAKVVVLAGFEPEDESPIVFLRLRKAMRKKGLKVLSVAPFASRGLEKLSGTLLPCIPGHEATALLDLESSDAGAGLREAGADAVILVGERLASAPGALAAAVRLSRRTGARLAWVPRRAGERGALETGCLPVLLPGGRPLTAEAAGQLAAVWGVGSVPTSRGRSTGEILEAAAAGRLDALVVGGVDLADLPQGRAAREAISRAFVVSLETRDSEVTALADVVLPVAAHAEKSGTFVDWEGRLRPFEASLETELMSDYRVLDLLAGELDVFLGTRTVRQVEAELRELGPWEGGKPELTAQVAGVPNPTGHVVLSTWRELIDGGRLQDGEPYLAGTARPVVARLSPATAASAGLADGALVTVSSDQGSLSYPVRVTPGMADGVVWVPSNPRTAAGAAPGAYSVTSVLGVENGSFVTLSAGGAQ